MLVSGGPTELVQLSHVAAFSYAPSYLLDWLYGNAVRFESISVSVMGSRRIMLRASPNDVRHDRDDAAHSASS